MEILHSRRSTYRMPDWRAAIWAGIIAGIAADVLLMILVPVVLGQSPWAISRMAAAIVMGEDVLPPPTTFDLGIVIVATLVHFALSLLYALILAGIMALFNLVQAWNWALCWACCLAWPSISLTITE